MVALRIVHATTYRYRHRVALGAHRLMMRPRETPDLRLRAIEVSAAPQADVRWAQDVFGNAVATATFLAQTDQLHIECRMDVDLNAHPWPVFDVAPYALSFPFRYSDDDWTDLGALAARQYADPGGRLAAWAQRFVRSNPTDTLALLKDLSVGVATAISYQSRDDEGTQTPVETLQRGWGSCRDFAVLFAEAARSLGFGARIVSGYLFTPDGDAAALTRSGSTHAWAEVFAPGAGWISFDPTNRSVGGANLVPVAVGRNIAQVMPVSGSFTGMSDAFVSMTASVSVSAL
jgi:transglutaminase-like putative cysteine protease